MSIRRSKDKMWNDNQKNMRGADVCRAAKFADPQAGATVEALTDRDGTQANTITEQEEMLRRVSFPPDLHKQYFGLPRVGHVHQSVTEPAVKQVLFTLSIGKAPGAD